MVPPWGPETHVGQRKPEARKLAHTTPNETNTGVEPPLVGDYDLRGALGSAVRTRDRAQVRGPQNPSWERWRTDFRKLEYTTPHETNTSAEPPQDLRGGRGGP